MTPRGALRGLYAAHGVSVTGNMVTVIALPLFVLGETGSPALTGLAAFFSVLPIVLGAGLGGVAVDRIGYRRASVVCDLVGGVSIAAIPLLAATVGLPLWALFALVFATNFFDAPGEAARGALLPDLAAAARLPLERATGGFEGLERAARLLGGPLAGVLVALVGPVNALLVNAASFVVAAALMAAFVPRTVDCSLQPRGGGSRAYWQDLREGMTFLRHDRLLWSMTLLLIVTNSLEVAWSAVLLPIHANEQLGGPVAMGVLVSAAGLGALVGSVAFGLVGARIRRSTLFGVAFLIGGCPRMLTFALDPSWWACVVTVALAGVAMGTVNPLLSTVRLERTPPALRARVNGTMRAGAWAAMPLGALAAGVLVDRVGLTIGMTVVGAGYLLAALVPLARGTWQAMDHRPTTRTAATKLPSMMGPGEPARSIARLTSRGEPRGGSGSGRPPSVPMIPWPTHRRSSLCQHVTPLWPSRKPHPQTGARTHAEVARRRRPTGGVGFRNVGAQECSANSAMLYPPWATSKGGCIALDFVERGVIYGRASREPKGVEPACRSRSSLGRFVGIRKAR